MKKTRIEEKKKLNKNESQVYFHWFITLSVTSLQSDSTINYTPHLTCHCSNNILAYWCNFAGLLHWITFGRTSGLNKLLTIHSFCLWKNLHFVPFSSLTIFYFDSLSLFLNSNHLWHQVLVLYLDCSYLWLLMWLWSPQPVVHTADLFLFCLWYKGLWSVIRPISMFWGVMFLNGKTTGGAAKVHSNECCFAILVGWKQTNNKSSVSLSWTNKPPKSRQTERHTAPAHWEAGQMSQDVFEKQKVLVDSSIYFQKKTWDDCWKKKKLNQ